MYFCIFNLFCIFIFALIWAGSSASTELTLNGKFTQGGLVWGTTVPQAKVHFNGRPIRISANGNFLIGFSRNAAPKARLTTKFPNGLIEIRNLKIKKRKYQIQRIDGLPSKMVTPPQSVYDRIGSENQIIANARARDTAQDLFTSGWVWPTLGTISGVYGSQRILNGMHRRPHYGIDIAAKQGTNIKSSGAGVVTMAEDDLYYTGGTIIMDHGHGISTIYSHLETVIVSVGDKINQGDIIGTVGSTGRSTGPHLDFRINWFQTRLDPMSILN